MNHAFGIDWAFWSPIVIGVWALLMVALERAFPYDRRQKLFREGFVLDMFLYTFAQSYVLGLVIAKIIEGLDRLGGGRLHAVSGWPLWAQVGFFFVTHDLYIYLFHRLQHRNRWLWRTHEAHHSGHDVDWLSGSRSHPLEILVNQTVEYAPIVLLGAHPEVALVKGVLDATWGMFIHSNIDVRLGVLQYVINGPEMHRWHHSSDEGLGPENKGVNFATKIAVWDWLFGTGYLPAGKKPETYGIYGNPDFPKGYLGQIVHAFRPFPRPKDVAQEAAE
ncbi:MAG: sterol desaturase family protein [Myxococcales bacterium]|jgi:sterol desaturase/sphingolipid hydroxylase (fatty acid hydroxylase superfamily)|nr:sterol desaturase family protein [Myxococcales bacterium]MBL9112709.1 sterol desaturase family protein [Myxococcales bacterium]